MGSESRPRRGTQKAINYHNTNVISLAVVTCVLLVHHWYHYSTEITIPYVYIMIVVIIVLLHVHVVILGCV